MWCSKMIVRCASRNFIGGNSVVSLRPFNFLAIRYAFVLLECLKIGPKHLGPFVCFLFGRPYAARARWQKKRNLRKIGLNFQRPKKANMFGGIEYLSSFLHDSIVKRSFCISIFTVRTIRMDGGETERSRKAAENRLNKRLIWMHKSLPKWKDI